VSEEIAYPGSEARMDRSCAADHGAIIAAARIAQGFMTEAVYAFEEIGEKTVRKTGSR
jgi:hypothetical protein